VAEICRRLDGIPLAIELAAARTVSLSPMQILARLDERFRLLTGGRRTAVERHQTLRATVDWSYRLLDEPTRLVFDRLSVFAGGFSLEDAEAVVADDAVDRYEVLEAVTSLVNKSMVVAVHDDGTPRYRLLETMRQYGQERLDAAGTREVVQVRHARHLAAISEQIAQGWCSPDEQFWRRRLAGELDNLRAAVAFAVARSDTDLAIRLMAPLSVLTMFCPSWGLGTLAEAVLALPGADHHRLAVGVLSTAAFGALSHGDLHRAIDLADQATAIVDRGGHASTAGVWAVAANSEGLLGDPAANRRRIAAGMAIAERLGDPFEIAFVAAMGATSLCNDRALAVAYADRATSAIAGLGGPMMRGTLAGFGAMAYFDTDPQRAITGYEAHFATDAELGPNPVGAWAAGYLAMLYADRGDSTTALQRAREGIDRARDVPLVLVIIIEYTAVALSTLEFHETAALLYAAVDAGIVAPFAHALQGWPQDVRTRGRDLTLAALGPETIERQRRAVAGKTVTDIVSIALAELDVILAALADDPAR
jgi:hypothetical protein